MAVSFVGSGAVATANNASVTPPLPSGLVDGDIIMVVGMVRAPARTFTAPAGWAAVTYYTNTGTGTAAASGHRIFMTWRRYVAGVTAPVMTIGGTSVTGADVIARVHAFRGARSDRDPVYVGSTYSSGTTTGTSIGPINGYFESANGGMTLAIGAQVDDFGTPTTPSGWTLVATDEATAGNDASLLVYRRDSTATNGAQGPAVTMASAPTAAAARVGVQMWIEPEPPPEATFPSIPAGQVGLVDNFARTSTTSPGTADTGQAWTAVYGQFGTNGSAIYSVTANDGDQVYVETGSTTQEISAVVQNTVGVSGAYWSLLPRWVDGGSFYNVEVETDGSIDIQHWSSFRIPVDATTRSQPGAIANGDRVTVRIWEVRTGQTRIQVFRNAETTPLLNYLDEASDRYEVLGTKVGLRHGEGVAGVAVRWGGPFRIPTATNGVASGTNYTRTPGDTAGGVDSAAASLAATRSAGDVAATADASAAVVARARDAGDTAAATDSVTYAITRSLDGTGIDTAGATDSAAYVLARDLAATGNDTAGAADASARTVAASRDGTDLAGAVDAASPAIVRPVTAGDVAAAGDSAARVLDAARPQADTAGATDAATYELVVALDETRTAGDTAGTADTASARLDAARAETDTAAAGDTASRTLALSRDANSGASATDAASASLAHSRGASGTATTADAADATVARSRPAESTAATADSATYTLGAASTAEDTAAAADQAAVVRDVVRTAADGAGATDSATASVVRNYSFTVGSAAGALDEASPARTVERTSGNTAAATDASTSALILLTSATAADTAGTQDTASRTVDASRPQADTADATDTATYVLARVHERTVADAAGTEDTASPARTVVRTTADSAGTADQATGALVLLTSRTPTDTAGTADAATWLMSTGRTEADSAATADEATWTITRVIVREVADGAGAVDGSAPVRTVTRQPGSTALAEDLLELTRTLHVTVHSLAAVVDSARAAVQANLGRLVVGFGSTRFPDLTSGGARRGRTVGTLRDPYRPYRLRDGSTRGDVEGD